MTSVGAVALATTVGLAAYAYVDLADVAMLYLIAIAAASVSGRGPAVLAASLAVAAFDFCFIPPRFTFVIAQARHGITFAVMFAAGLTISTLMTRLRRREAEAQAAALRARAEELRSSLLSVVSHDLRTPLAVITGAATALRDDDTRLSAAARADLLDTLVGEASRLERVVANLLGLTRVETGAVPARDRIPVEELVGSALGRVEQLAGDAVTTDVPADVEVDVDPILFEQVLINLVENAVKHGAAPVEISARRDGDRVHIDVADHGPGLPAGTEERVFEKFFRASSTPGVGLGLAVVRGIVVAHGGTVAAVPSPAGARFRVTLPAPAGAAR